MKQLPTLETKRLILRPFTVDDAANVHDLVSEHAIAETTLSFPHPYKDGMAEAWISAQQALADSGEKVIFAMMRKSDGAMIGSISLMGLEEKHQAEFGFFVGLPFWNNGYCTEAGQALLRYAFSDLGLVRVHACHLSRNPSSGRVMQKLGMSHEGKRRQHVRKWGEFEDVEMYGILVDQWKVADQTPATDGHG